MAPVRIELQRDCVLRSKADVCVSTVHRTGNLTKGPLAKQFLKACGQSVQDELFQVCNGGDLKHGEVVLTEVGKLKQVQNLMFVCLYSWRPGNEQVLMNSVLECLELATVQGHRSIAFPALGMGGQKYPAHKVAAALIDAVALHNMQYSSEELGSHHSLEVVYIVLLDEQIEAIKAFLEICTARRADIEDSLNEGEIGESETHVMNDYGSGTGEANYADMPNASRNASTGPGPNQSFTAGASSATGHSNAQGSARNNQGQASGWSLLGTTFFQAIVPMVNSYIIQGRVGYLHYNVRPSVSKRGVSLSLDVGVDIGFFTDFIPKTLEAFWKGVTSKKR